jgi:hypothetical protein
MPVSTSTPVSAGGEEEWDVLVGTFGFRAEGVVVTACYALTALAESRELLAEAVEVFVGLGG